MGRLPCALVWMGAWLVAAPAAAQVSLSMRASASEVRVDETFQLQISIESESLQAPDVTLPGLDEFVVLQRQVSRPMSFSFSFGGRQQAVRSTTHYIFVLQPTREGRFTLPAVEARVGNKVFRSDPLTIVVRGSTAPPASPGAAEPGTTAPAPDDAPPTGPYADAAQVDEIAFIRAVADKPEPYVGEHVTVTFYLYLRGNVQAAPSVDTQPTTDGFWIHDLITPSGHQPGHRQIVKGLAYTAYTLRRFAAFPLRAGELTIGPMAVTIDQSSVFDLFAGRVPAALRREGLPLKLVAKPLPEAGRPSGEVAIGQFTVSAKLDRNQAATGDAVTLTATVQGTGNIRAAKLATPAVDGLRILEPQVRDVVETPGDLAGGIRTYEWLVVPERAGSFAVPPLSLAVFDPATQRYSSVQSESLTLVAAGAAVTSTPATSSTTSSSETEPSTPEEEQPTYAPIRTASELRRKAPSLLATAGYRIGLLLPPLVWLLVVIGGAARARVVARRNAPSAERDIRHARELLQQAARDTNASSFYAAVSQALVEVVQARVGEPIGGYTTRALHALLLERGMTDELARQLTGLMSACEQARFSTLGASRSEMDAMLGRARDCFDAIARFVPRKEDAR